MYAIFDIDSADVTGERWQIWIEWTQDGDDGFLKEEEGSGVGVVVVVAVVVVVGSDVVVVVVVVVVGSAVVVVVVSTVVVSAVVNVSDVVDDIDVVGIGVVDIRK